LPPNLEVDPSAFFRGKTPSLCRCTFGLQTIPRNDKYKGGPVCTESKVLTAFDLSELDLISSFTALLLQI